MNIGLSLDLWIEYLLRFSHLVAGIYWIGSSFYFIWLDSSFEPPEKPQKNLEGEVFMVHGGFYYQVLKKKIFPGELPKVLHWFKWEATLTLITGYCLFVYLYLFNGASLLIDPNVYEMSQLQAISYSVTLIVASWFVYDWIWHPRFVSTNDSAKKISGILFLLYIAALIFLNFKLFSGRGAFIILGVIFGSLMVLNVWVRILPGQAKMIKAAENGEVPDYSESIKSKVRSVHNTYFIFPVLFIMLSNHYPLVYNSPHNWFLLILLSLSGALARHAMVAKDKSYRWLLVPSAIGLLFIVYLTAMGASRPSLASAGEYHYVTDIQPLVQKHCNGCHASQPTDVVFKVAPKGLILETELSLRQNKEKILQQVWHSQIMPLANQTKMTMDERKVLASWLQDPSK